MTAIVAVFRCRSASSSDCSSAGVSGALITRAVNVVYWAACRARAPVGRRNKHIRKKYEQTNAMTGDNSGPSDRR